MRVLTRADVERAFDLDEQFRHVDEIFARVFHDATQRPPSQSRDLSERCVDVVFTGIAMRARVFVTLKPSVFDPQGRTIADALHSLGYGGVDDVRQGKVFRARSEDRRKRRRPGRLPPRSPTSCSRIRSSRAIASRSTHEVRGRGVSRQQLRRGRVPCGDRRARPARRVRLAQGDRPRRAPTSSSSRAASRTATTCARARWRASRRSCGAVETFAAAAVRCSASATASRFCSRPGCCRARCCATATLKFHCEHVHIRVEQTDTPFTRACRAGAGPAHPDRPRRGQLLRRAGVIARLEANRQVDLPLHGCRGPRHRRGQSERRGRTASPASATRLATSSA